MGDFLRRFRKFTAKIKEFGENNSKKLYMYIRFYFRKYAGNGNLDKTYAPLSPGTFSYKVRNYKIFGLKDLHEKS